MIKHMGSSRYIHAREGVGNNDPPIEVNQNWIAYVDGVVFRRLRILAKHPDGGWIYKDEPAGMKRSDYSRLGVTPEFNLRYVFELEQSD